MKTTKMFPGLLAMTALSGAIGFNPSSANDTIPGMSGGLVFDTQGDVIGIHGRGDRSGADGTGQKTGFNLAIPINTFRRWKEEAEKVSNYSEAFSGTWKGIYICRQGITGLTLEITPLEITPTATSIGAVFNFYPIPENPNVKSGSFSLTGQLSMDGSFELTPNRWIEQPAGYVMVGMSGNINFERKELVGSITTSSCSNFQLQKQ